MIKCDKKREWEKITNVYEGGYISPLNHIIQKSKENIRKEKVTK